MGKGRETRERSGESKEGMTEEGQGLVLGGEREGVEGGCGEGMERGGWERDVREWERIVEREESVVGMEKWREWKVRVGRKER